MRKRHKKAAIQKYVAGKPLTPNERRYIAGASGIVVKVAFEVLTDAFKQAAEEMRRFCNVLNDTLEMSMGVPSAYWTHLQRPRVEAPTVMDRRPGWELVDGALVRVVGLPVDDEDEAQAEGS